jgi:hypothetical protein
MANGSQEKGPEKRNGQGESKGEVTQKEKKYGDKIQKPEHSEFAVTNLGVFRENVLHL